MDNFFKGFVDFINSIVKAIQDMVKYFRALGDGKTDPETPDDGESSED